MSRKINGQKEWIELAAEWCDDEQQYEIPSSHQHDAWFSDDGDNWVDGAGLCADGDIFLAATIRLVGGPRDGETVA